LQPFPVSRSSSEVKLNSCNQNNNRNFTKYLNKLHAEAKA